FNFPINLIGLPTVREENGLAKSSRNVHLSKEEVLEAQWLYRALIEGQKQVVDGEKDPTIVMNKVIQTIEQHTDGKIDYVELLSYPALEEITMINEQVILAVAVRFKHVRLIDNLIFDPY